jgi:predicted house-cleaning noncanonical NTP pyrophosphatase (MazG superfamily)
MTEEEFDKTLNFFSRKISVKGSSPSDKLKSLIHRWEKVIEDCEKSSDKSAYRYNFSEAHKTPLKKLKDSISEIKTDQEAESLADSLAEVFMAELRNAIEQTGKSDALSYIILELKHCRNN